MSGERAVDVHVHWIRAQIEADPSHPARLIPVHGAGYRLDPVLDAPQNADEGGVTGQRGRTRHKR